MNQDEEFNLKDIQDEVMAQKEEDEVARSEEQTGEPLSEEELEEILIDIDNTRENIKISINEEGAI